MRVCNDLYKRIKHSRIFSTLEKHLRKLFKNNLLSYVIYMEEPTKRTIRYKTLIYDMGRPIEKDINGKKYTTYSNSVFIGKLYKGIGINKISLSYSRKEDNKNIIYINCFRDKKLQLSISYYKLSNKYYLKTYNDSIDIKFDDNNEEAKEALKQISNLLSDKKENWEYLGDTDN